MHVSIYFHSSYVLNNSWMCSLPLFGNLPNLRTQCTFIYVGFVMDANFYFTSACLGSYQTNFVDRTFVSNIQSDHQINSKQLQPDNTSDYIAGTTNRESRLRLSVITIFFYFWLQLYLLLFCATINQLLKCSMNNMNLYLSNEL